MSFFAVESILEEDLSTRKASVEMTKKNQNYT